jgi:predicted DNA-binding antitoxin AbrB/MazE fold protein
VEKTFEAVYENGVLRPLENLDLSNMQHLLVTISDSTATDASAYFEAEEWVRDMKVVIREFPFFVAFNLA